MALAPCCSFCGTQKHLSHCGVCKVVVYCSQDHQVSDRGRHAPRCKAVKRKRRVFEREEQKVRDEPGDGLFTPANPFETSVGHFWGIMDTRTYMRARYAYAGAVLKIKTFDAVDLAASHLRNMIHLNRSDNMGVRDQLPALYLRLGRDQEAYDFIKWWQRVYDDSTLDYSDDVNLPYLDIVDADVFEPPDYLCGEFPDLCRLVCVTLLKFKLLMDIKALQHCVWALEERKLPREIIDRVKYFIPTSPIIQKDNRIMSKRDYTKLMINLYLHLDQLILTVIKANSHFWPALLNPGTHLEARPQYTSRGSVEEMQYRLQHWYDAWDETPGAIDFIKAEIKNVRCSHHQETDSEELDLDSTMGG